MKSSIIVFTTSQRVLIKSYITHISDEILKKKNYQNFCWPSNTCDDLYLRTLALWTATWLSQECSSRANHPDRQLAREPPIQTFTTF